jgi:hypothetical protein
MPESVRDESGVEVDARLGVAPIHGRLGDVSLSANLSECWHCVYWAGRSKCGYLPPERMPKGTATETKTKASKLN